MQFQAHNIEKTPSAADKPEEQYHFVIASNAIHATKSLRVSTDNVRKALREDGFLMMMEMTRTPKQGAWPRQMDALEKKGFHLPEDVLAKISVLETDLAQSNLGLSDDDYRLLLDNTTHIIHNAWLMHSKWPVQRFMPQLRIHANMLNLAAHISARHRHQRRVVSFAFVSSIATIGYHPLHTRSPIAGSRLNGHWNSMEHVSFLLKSSQTIGALPDLPGTMGWTPADDIARATVEIVTQPDGNDNRVDFYPIYHIENPVRQPWATTLAVLADEMGISPAYGGGGIIPFQEWLCRVREWPRRGDNTPEGANPAHLMVDFLEDHFLRMSCGGLLMGTAHAREHSSTLARTGPVSEDMIRLFVQSWKKTGFLFSEF
ncbi:hypothetical protein KVR01_006082 [Diaporthe batatas]|uniref:uncharacterized protein n=1 Tax=Diaporthe batatas TaxID=748121 RepID=UPI001D05B0A2|nr:uncharacterized protein KVR01_006082 [Diaporthe batatas]KAG8164164.1 hypothetical protein KVR01_006082 [Diaporthe batatas]